MPTILRRDGYRFFFYSWEPGEPPHIHVAHDGKTAKYWLYPLELASSDGFRAHELTELRDVIAKHRANFLSKWDEHHKPPGQN